MPTDLSASDVLPIDLLVSAQIRIAGREGVPIVVRQRGDDVNGTLLLKINLLNGTSRVINQMRVENELVWCPVSRTDPMPESDAETYLRRQAENDPDLWIVEVEDKQGRTWFPGRLISL